MARRKVACAAGRHLDIQIARWDGGGGSVAALLKGSISTALQSSADGAPARWSPLVFVRLPRLLSTDTSAGRLCCAACLLIDPPDCEIHMAAQVIYATKPHALRGHVDFPRIYSVGDEYWHKRQIGHVRRRSDSQETVLAEDFTSTSHASSDACSKRDADLSPDAGSRKNHEDEPGMGHSAMNSIEHEVQRLTDSFCKMATGNSAGAGGRGRDIKRTETRRVRFRSPSPKRSSTRVNRASMIDMYSKKEPTVLELSAAGPRSWDAAAAEYERQQYGEQAQEPGDEAAAAADGQAQDMQLEEAEDDYGSIAVGKDGTDAEFPDPGLAPSRWTRAAAARSGRPLLRSESVCEREVVVSVEAVSVHYDVSVGIPPADLWAAREELHRVHGLDKTLYEDAQVGPGEYRAFVCTEKDCTTFDVNEVPDTFSFECEICVVTSQDAWLPHTPNCVTYMYCHSVPSARGYMNAMADEPCFKVKWEHMSTDGTNTSVMTPDNGILYAYKGYRPQLVSVPGSKEQVWGLKMGFWVPIDMDEIKIEHEQLWNFRIMGYVHIADSCGGQERCLLVPPKDVKIEKLDYQRLMKRHTV
ncbi:hypothetical protein WOLCODRAFT_141431 [Wolfiporia cocos MD-104 SS10]|uniref:Uncharacterized protein n=1 Tax=Wolfiporia cocos (strain MD-104) TaxID=742152 RepID=A0A2H3IU59_WOLCO|nr:hypothetical protein WOLCODRAFT_141431 [Wolfiporia cocos MD-104 SS10]